MQRRLDRLSVVMPVFNEGPWVERAVGALEAASERAGLPCTVLVVDDGSTDETVAMLDGLAAAGRIRLIRQENAGRFAARRAGLEAVDSEMTLLLDARVILDPEALVYLAEAIGQGSTRSFNAHVDVVSEGNPWAAFWSGITKVGWRRYFAHPRHVEFGEEDFDAYPKGTGAFCAATAVLREAADAFDSLFADARFASDDTRMLRHIAATTGIAIDPRFRVDYFGRDSFGRWAKQVFFRGTTFVDGYLGDTRRAVPLLALAALAALGTGGALRRRPGRVLAAAGVVEACAALATRGCGGTARETLAVGGLLAPFTLVFGTGVLRGLVMVARR